MLFCLQNRLCSSGALALTCPWCIGKALATPAARVASSLSSCNRCHRPASSKQNQCRLRPARQPMLPAGTLSPSLKSAPLLGGDHRNAAFALHAPACCCFCDNDVRKAYGANTPSLLVCFSAMCIVRRPLARRRRGRAHTPARRLVCHRARDTSARIAPRIMSHNRNHMFTTAMLSYAHR